MSCITKIKIIINFPLKFTLIDKYGLDSNNLELKIK